MINLHTTHTRAVHMYITMTNIQHTYTRTHKAIHVAIAIQKQLNLQKLIACLNFEKEFPCN